MSNIIVLGRMAEDMQAALRELWRDDGINLVVGRQLETGELVVAGPRDGPHIDTSGRLYSSASRFGVIEAMRRTLRLRYRHADPDTGDVQPLAEAWITAARAAYDGWLDCEMSIDVGWGWLVLAMCEHVSEIISDSERQEFGFRQIKEKFGDMRAYNTGSTEIQTLVDAYELLSCVICERCGSPGKHRVYSGYHCVRCDECDATEEWQ